MPPRHAALPLALLLAAAPASAADPPGAEPPEAGTFEEPPALASQADAALWRRARDVGVAVPVERGVSTRLQAQANGSRWQARLAEGVRRGALGEPRAAELRARLLDAWNELALVLSARWPVDATRVCGYPWLDFDSTLQAGDSSFRELPQARGRLGECVEEASLALAALRQTNGALRAALEAIDREAPAVPPLAAQRLAATVEWRAARWGMTLDEVLRAFPGEARRLDAPIALADGNLVAAGIDRHELAGVAFRVRFVFDPGGGLALVSLRTGEQDPATPARYEAVQRALAERLGPPAARAADDAFVDMRQTTWRAPSGRVDVKLIPGTLVVLHAAPSQQPARSLLSSPPLRGGEGVPSRSP